MSFAGPEGSTAGPVFARHETFHPRHGWIKKGFDAAVEDSRVYSRDDAPVILGVGKNMVRAIRYWCHAFRVLESGPTGSFPTQFGERLLGTNGWDPYIEDPGSLWLLHERLLREPSHATAWEYAFFVTARPEFTPDDLAHGLQEFAVRTYPAARVAPSSLRKDVNCLIRMYSPAATQRGFSEESMRCPFVDMGLLAPGMVPGSFSFVFGTKPGLSPEIVAAASLGFAARTTPGARTVALSRLLRDRGGPGATFKLTESALYGSLEKAVESHPQLDLTEAGGIVQLAFEDAETTATQLIEAHFLSRGVYA